MENATAKTQYKVGIFVGVGLIVLMVSILVLGGDKAFFTRYVYLHTEMEQVQGLFPGSIVSLSGIPVGNVDQIEFVPGENRLRIVLRVARQFLPRIRKGSTAEVRTQGALGDKFVYITPGPLGGEQVADGGSIEANASSDFFDKLTSKEDGVGRVLDLIKEMHQLVATLNADNRIGQTADNIRAMSAQMRVTMMKIDQLVGNLNSQVGDDQQLKTALKSLASVMQKIDSGKGTLGALVNDPSLHQNLKAFLGGSQRSGYMKDIVRESIKQSEKK
jgi:phospholipid/cholesterol/gamma-HCH transport system substrate-binding protein